MRNDYYSRAHHSTPNNNNNSNNNNFPKSDLNHNNSQNNNFSNQKSGNFKNNRRFDLRYYLFIHKYRPLGRIFILLSKCI
jgi:hypothetical protein